MDKYQLIVDALQQLIVENRGQSCSVSDIAKQAGIGKGSIYYYFQSKEEILDALVQREYGEIIEKCGKKIEQSPLPPAGKLALLFETYFSYQVDNKLDRYMHAPENAYIHQKSLAAIVVKLSPILANILMQGQEEGVFACPHPEEWAQFMVTELCFLLDLGIFPWSQGEVAKKAEALALFFERVLQAPRGTFAFLCEGRHSTQGQSPL